METLDSDLLRTFLAVAETGSVTEGAVRIYRSQSAASMQIKRLESVLGQRVFERHGRGVVLTETGARLLPIARDVTASLDATLRSLTSDRLEGKLRLGIPDDHSQTILARIIGAFSQSHPLVELEVTCALSTGFPEALKTGHLDLAVYEVERPDHPDDVLYEDRTCWVCSRHFDLPNRDPLPVALFDRDCWWRDAALSYLENSGRRFRVIYSSQSVTGVKAAIEAGIAIGLLGQSSLSDQLVVLDEDAGFGAMPTSKLVLGCRPGADTEPVLTMKSAITDAFKLERKSL